MKGTTEDRGASEETATLSVAEAVAVVAAGKGGGSSTETSRWSREDDGGPWPLAVSTAANCCPSLERLPRSCGASPSHSGCTRLSRALASPVLLSSVLALRSETAACGDGLWLV